MTLDEAREQCQQLVKINLDIWNERSTGAKKELRKKYSNLYTSIIAAGYKITRGRVFDSMYGRTIPYAVPTLNKNRNSIAIIDNRSKNGYHKGDCTTRCISFCTGIDYDIIQKEQFNNAKNAHNSPFFRKKTWRTPSVWSLSLTSRGFVEIVLKRHVTRATFIKMFKNSQIDRGIIATRSSTHVAAIDMQKNQILDTWDSSGGRILSIYVPKVQYNEYVRALNSQDLL